MALHQKLARLQALGWKKALQMKWENFLWTKVFSLFEPLGLSVLPSHFYSPVPNTADLRRNQQRWNKPSALVGIDISIEAQEAFLHHLMPFREECAALPDYDWVTQQGFGEGYGLVDAHLLYAMMRYFKPRRMLEIGSGVSTFFALRALEANARDQSTPQQSSTLTCVEPYPRKGLQKLAASGDVELITKPVQDVSLDTFQQLGEHDLLFIDSSHVLKLDSDVWFLYLEVLPRLNKGVVIHIHDIFFPFSTPDPEIWIFRQHQFWNESPLVQALLMHNSLFKILTCSSYLHYYSPKTLQNVVSAYNPEKYFASSLWLQKQQ